MTAEQYEALGNKLFKNKAFSVADFRPGDEEDSYRVEIKAERMLLPKETAGVFALIRALLGTDKVDIKFDQTEALAAIRGENDKAARFLTDTWAEIMPELSPILRNSEAEFTCGPDGDMLTLHVAPDFCGSYLDSSSTEFRSEASSRFGWSFAVSIVPDGDVSQSIRDGFYSPEAAMPRPSSAPAPARAFKPRAAAGDPASLIYGRQISHPEITSMAEFNEQTGAACAEGSIINVEYTDTKNGKRKIVKFTFTDLTNTLSVKLFPETEKADSVIAGLEDVMKSGDRVLVRGNYEFDTFSRDYSFIARDIVKRPAEKRMDNAPEGGKRVELHLHTQSSTMDALTKVSDVIATAAKWGHRAIAITDHGVVHSLPEAMKAAKKNGIKVIFGCEGYLVGDSTIHAVDERPYTALYAAASVSPAGCSLYSLSAVRFTASGDEIGRFFTLASSGGILPKWAQEDYGIDENEYASAPDAAQAVREFLGFAEGSVIVCYNEGVLDALSSVLDDESLVPYEYVDINKLDLNVHLDIKDYSMESGCAPISGRYETVPHQPVKTAADEVRRLFLHMTKELEDRGVPRVSYWDRRRPDYKKLQRYHIIILAASLPGLKNLYKLVSYSHLQYFFKRPCIPRSLLDMYRGGLLLGSACEAGELYRAVSRGLPEEEQKRIASWYDYLEIQPLCNNEFMLDSEEHTWTEDDLRDYNRRVIEIGDELNKLTVATCDVHFQNPEDAIFRSILLHSQGFRDSMRMTPLYFRTTEEMLEEFSYLGEERAKEVVVTNPNVIADLCGEQLHPFLDEKFTYSPELPNAKEILQEMTMTEAHRRYGDPLPEIVQKRLDKELNSIVGNGYSSLYMVAEKLVKKSLSDGYLVGSRGSVGSSFVATMLGITEVNALPPHYLCPECKYSEFILDSKSRCGIDLPDKVCPNCGAKLRKEGYDIPFEVFLGFKGDKTPDIDLNFSGDYQPVAHRFTEEMFGPGHAFRAGTISGVQDKTVYGYVKHYLEDYGLVRSEPEINRLVQGCLGVKKTSGQHPGGIVIVPEDYEIFDFCPVQHPADKNDAGSVTTHFDFHALDDKLVKLDILGHDDPTVLRMLHDMTGLDPRTIPLDDPETMSIYRTDEALKVSLAPLDCDVGSLAIPEFGTNFVRGMLKETRPTTMEELVRISGLSHGTDVWNNNAQVLVQNKVATLMEVICTRDDIMNYLISMGGDPSLSFKTMESVRKGRGLKEEMEAMMHEINVPEWFIDSCKKIKYMFPRAHAAAYVMMSFRVAYYKVHYPLEFYAVYFTVRADTFDISLCGGGLDSVMRNIKLIKAKDKPEQKEKDALTILEVVAEMNLRGFELLPVDIYRSKATVFTIEDGKLRPPFTAVPGLGESVAVLIEKGREGGEYSSKEDFARRTKANTGIIEKLDELGCLDSLEETDQISFGF